MLNDFVPDPTLYQIFSPLDVIPEGNLGYIRNTVTGLYYRLTVPSIATRIAPFVADANSPATPNVTNPLLQPAVTARGVSVRLATTTPTVDRPHGYTAVAAINNFQAPDLSATSGIFNWCVNTFVVRQNVAALPHRTPDLINALNDIPIDAETP